MIYKWGKPTLKIGKCGENGTLATELTEMPKGKKDTTKYASTPGEVKKLLGEGDEIVAMKAAKSSHAIEVTIFVPADDTRPIVDNEGKIEDYYSIILIPEAANAVGIQMNKCFVTCEELLTSEEGATIKYIFQGLEDNEGKIKRAYTQNNAG